jgi:hypothetical protein
MPTRLCTPLVAGTFASAIALAGCQHHPAGTAVEPAPKTAAHTQPRHPATPIKAPEFGGVTTKHVEVTATGRTLQAAVNNAIQLAVQQVDGVRVAARTVQASLSTTLQANGQQANVSSAAYANLVATATNGAVTNFQLLSQQQIHTPVSTDQEHLNAKHDASWRRGNVNAHSSASIRATGAYSDGYAAAGADDNTAVAVSGSDQATASGAASEQQAVNGHWNERQGASSVDYNHQHTDYTSSWQVRIGADVAVYRESAAAKRTTVIVAEPVINTQTYEVGDSQVPASTIADAIQTEVSDALTETHRFTVLDRNADPEINAEVQRIEAGNDVASAAARIGQQLAADLIVIPTIDHFTYARHERQLQLAQRTLAWYSGDAEVSFRVVNATTSQIVMAKSFHYAFPSTSPTTLGVSVDGIRLTQQMMGAIGHDIVGSILRSTYPVLVVAAEGPTVVLNQGGDAVGAGMAYDAVFLGKPVVDPESGQSLGPVETPCCTIVVDRVTPKLAYGHVVGDTPPLPTPFKPGTIELTGTVALPASVPPPTLAARATHVRRQERRKSATSAVPPASGDSNW